jgi:hypothetical protein
MLPLSDQNRTPCRADKGFSRPHDEGDGDKLIQIGKSKSIYLRSVRRADLIKALFGQEVLWLTQVFIHQNKELISPRPQAVDPQMQRLS